MTRRILIALCLIVAILLAGVLMMGRTTYAAAVTPVQYNGNPTCADLGYLAYEFKVDPPTSGTYWLDSTHYVTVVFSSGGKVVDWNSNLAIDAVIVKGGNNGANLYAYLTEWLSDTGLLAPLNTSGTQPAISHVDFCYDYEVDVDIEADGHYDRTWAWDNPSKVSDRDDEQPLVIPHGGYLDIVYTITLDADFTDSNWWVDGAISVFNPDPFNAATIEEISLVIDGLSAFDPCEDEGVTYPYSLASLETLECEFSTTLSAGDAGTATVTVTTSGAVGGGSDSDGYAFSGPPDTETDECVTVADVVEGPLGNHIPFSDQVVCANELPKTIEFTVTLGDGQDLELVCGDQEIVNFVAQTTNDSSTVQQNNPPTYHRLLVTYLCPGGCTLTQGYWKNHSANGPAPYDDTWAMLPDDEDTPFFSSGQTWYTIMFVQPSKGVYYKLAHQYVAVQLNIANGASVPPEVQVVLDRSLGWFTDWTPSQMQNMYKNNTPSGIRAQINNAVTTLDQYNNGLIGPGHCSE